MAKHPELCFILLSVFVTFLSNYGSSIKSKPLVIPARMPEPLFPPVSSVLDLYLGDLRPLVEMLHHEDLIFVMYYAPWCAKSHNAVFQFLKAAQYLERQVKFVAVNCWYPEGLCRKQYKFLLYPVFFAYQGENDGYRYLGIERAEFMVKFLEDLLNPLTLLTSINHVKDFITEHDIVIAGYFDLNSSPQPPGFQQFYFASMRVVEHDPFQPVKFGLITDYNLAVQCHMRNSSDIIILRINNSTLKYPFPNNITSTNLVRWVFAYRHQLPVRWLVPLGMKSLMLSQELNRGPAIIMFHRASPLSSSSQTLAAFKHLALSYNMCPQDEMAADFSRRWLTLSVHNVLRNAKTLNFCKDFQKGHLYHTNTLKCCISTSNNCENCFKEAKLNVCEICQHRPGAQRSSVCSFEESVHMENNSLHTVLSLPSNSCQNSISAYDVSSYTSVCCKWCNKNVSYTEFLTPPFSTSTYHQSSEGRRPTDRYVIESLEDLPRKLCNRLTFQKSQDNYPKAIIPDFASTSLPGEFNGLGCRLNQTLNFFTLDSQNHWMIANGLGVDVSQAHLSPVVIAFDKENERQVVLQDKFSKKATASFIINFTKGILPRHQRSVASARQEGCRSKSSLCMTELTTDTFQAFIDQPKDVVILIYAAWCGFCAAVSHTFLHLAHYFHTSPNITFARINGDSNDLPWEFSMDSYPTIIFFPAYREADSVAFPDTMEQSLPNLIRFVLQHATFTTRLHLVADVCSTTCVQENLELSRHTLQALRSKIQRLRTHLSALEFSKKPSRYHLAVIKILKKRITEIQSEIAEAKQLKEFLERNTGKHLNRNTVKDLLSDLMRRKDLSVGR